MKILEKVKCIMKTIVILIFTLISFLALPSCSTTKYSAYQIITEPEGANITFKANNRYMGKSPTSKWYTSKKISPDWWSTDNEIINEFIIEKPGYKTVYKSLTLYPKFKSSDEALSNPITLFVQLEPLSRTNNSSASNKTSQIIITSEPSGAAIYGNQNYWGQTPYKANVNWSSLQERIEIRFEKSGYLTSRRMVTSSDKKIHITLQPN